MCVPHTRRATLARKLRSVCTSVFGSRRHLTACRAKGRVLPGPGRFCIIADSEGEAARMTETQTAVEPAGEKMDFAGRPGFTPAGRAPAAP
jgi:hypothetical protein